MLAYEPRQVKRANRYIANDNKNKVSASNVMFHSMLCSARELEIKFWVNLIPLRTIVAGIELRFLHPSENGLLVDP